MALSEKLQFLLTVDARGAVKGFEQVGKAADKSLGRAEDRLDKLGGNMQKAGAAAMAFAGVAAGGLKKLADSASDLGEAVSKAGEIFGPNAKEIEKFGKTAAKSFGLSKREAVDAASRFGIFGRAAKLTGSELVNFSTDLTALAADMGSFNNVETAEVLDAIASALAGQSRPLQRFGVLLDQATLKARALEMGIYDGTGMLTGQQKVLAAHAEILAQTTVQAGDFSRTLGESLPNQAKVFSAELENLKAGIGEGVLPMFLGVTKAASGVVGAFNGMSESSKKTVGQFAALGTAAIGTLGALSFIGGTLIKMRRNFTDAAGGLNAMGKAAKGFGVAIGVATAALVVYSMQQAKNSKEWSQFARSLDDIGRASDDAIAGRFVDAVKLGGMAGKDFDGVLDEMTRSSIGSAQRLLDLERATGGVSTELQKHNVSAKSSAEVIAELEAAIIAETEAQKQAIITQQMSTDAIEDATDATEDATDAEGDREKQIAANVKALEKITEAQDDARKSTEDMHKATMGAIDSSLGYRNAQARSKTAIDEANVAMRKHRQGTSEYAQAARDAEGAALDQASAALRMAEDQAAANGQTLTARDRNRVYRDELIRLRDYLQGDARVAIQMHIDALNRIPKSINTVASFTSQARPGSSGGNAKSKQYGTAEGGIFTRPTQTWVAEGGQPEAVVPLKKGSTAPGASPLGGLGANTINLTVNAGLGTDGRDVGRLIVEELQKYQRRNGPGSLP